MLNVMCVMAVASVAAMVVAAALLCVPGLRTVARRSGIAAAVVFLSSAALFSHYSDAEAQARGFASFSEMRAVQKPSAGLTHPEAG